MRSKPLHDLSVAQLVERFVTLCLAQDEAILYDQISRFNRLYGQRLSVEEELKGRPGDKRRALTRFYDHPNAEVRLRSAFATLALEPDAARRTLQIISDRDEYPQAADARGMMRALDEGSYVPS